jgi:hypothetical protein
MLKKAYIILFLSIFILSALLFCSFFIFSPNNGDTLIIKLNNKVYARLPLDTDTEIVLEGNTVIIKGGYAFVSKADCPDKRCINIGKINKSGESIACLPHGLILEVE